MSQVIDVEISSLITKKHIAQFNDDGYTLIKNVFSSKEINQLAMAFDRWKEFGNLIGRTWRKQNTIVWIEDSVVRGMQWPSYHDSVMAKFRLDTRLLEIVEPFIGNNLKQIINQLHWKMPGSKISWPLHRDVRSRQPVEAFKDLFSSWVQTGIAIDHHREENGAMFVVPGSHKDFPADANDQSLYSAVSYKNDPRIKPLIMDPGDVVIWNAFVVHGGGFNSSNYLDRRFYINGYVKAENCTRGEWAWKNGRSVPLTEDNALIQFEKVNEVKEAFYPEDRNISEYVID